MWTRRSASGRRAGELLDIHPALGRHHRQVVAARAVKQHRRVELLRDRQQLLHEDPRHREAFEVGAEHPVRGRGRGVRRVAELHAAALAAAADLHLDLHHGAAARAHAWPKPRPPR